MIDPVAALMKQTGNVEGDDAMPDEADGGDDGGFSDPGRLMMQGAGGEMEGRVWAMTNDYSVHVLLVGIGQCIHHSSRQVEARACYPE